MAQLKTFSIPLADPVYDPLLGPTLYTFWNPNRCRLPIKLFASPALHRGNPCRNAVALPGGSLWSFFLPSKMSLGL
jgi:hypothetical protein